jgi:hypothetical protein
MPINPVSASPQVQNAQGDIPLRGKTAGPGKATPSPPAQVEDKVTLSRAAQAQSIAPTNVETKATPRVGQQ